MCGVERNEREESVAVKGRINDRERWMAVGRRRAGCMAVAPRTRANDTGRILASGTGIAQGLWLESVSRKARAGKMSLRVPAGGRRGCYVSGWHYVTRGGVFVRVKVRRRLKFLACVLCCRVQVAG